MESKDERLGAIVQLFRIKIKDNGTDSERTANELNVELN